MSKSIPERIWVPDVAQLAEYQCIVCNEHAQPGQTLVQCPRCKAIHHLSCWVQKGGCATRGCGQMADPSLLTSQAKASGDPPPKDNTWILVALTTLLLVLLIGGVLWGKYGRKTPTTDSIVVLVPSGIIDLDLARLQADIDTFAMQTQTEPAHIVQAPAGVLFDEKFVLMTLGKEPPDILILDAYHVTNYTENQALLSLDDLRQKLKPSIIAKINKQRKLFGIPYGGTDWFLSISNASRYPQLASQLLVHLANNIPFTEL